MKTRIRQSREEITGKAIPLEDWPEPDIEGVPEKKLSQYWANRKAVVMYAQGFTAEEISKEIPQACKIKFKTVSNMFRSGGSFNKTLECANGFFACVPGWRRPSDYSRDKPLPSKRTARNTGMAGALGQLLESRPSIHDALLALVHKRELPGVGKVNVIALAVVHKTFTDLCKEAGLTSADYPFNTARKGYAAIRDWLKLELARNPIAHAEGVYGEAAKKDTRRAHNSANSKTKYPQELAYGLSQLDGHVHDSLWTVDVTIHGNTFQFEAKLRPMLVALLDQKTKAALGHTETFQGQYSGSHLLRTFRTSLMPWTPLDLSAFEGSGFGYTQGAGFPSMRPEFAWLRPRSLAWDRHSAQVVASSNRTIRDVLGIHSVGMEGVGEGAARGDIEGAFNYLATEARQLPNATGRSPADPARRNPEKAAVNLHMNQNLAAVYFDVVLANYNAKPVTRAFGLSPLEQLNGCLADGLIYQNPMTKQEQERLLWKLLPSFQRRLNRAKEGTGPYYVELYGGARYSSLEIARNINLARYEGEYVTLYVEDDARFAHLVIPEPNGSGGRYMGRVTVQQARWRHPHPIEERALCGKLGKDALAEYLVKYPNMTLALHAFLVREARKLKSAAGIAAEMAMKRQGFSIEPRLKITDEELDLSKEFETYDDFEPDVEATPVVAVQPTTPLDPEDPDTGGFGGRIL